MDPVSDRAIADMKNGCGCDRIETAFEIVPGGGHTSQLDQVDAVITTLRTALDRIASWRGVPEHLKREFQETAPGPQRPLGGWVWTCRLELAR